MTLLEAPEPASRLPSNSLLADSVARFVSAATVEAMLAPEAAVAAVPAEVAAAGLLVTLPIDIIVPLATGGIRVVGRISQNLSRISRVNQSASRPTACGKLTLVTECRA